MPQLELENASQTQQSSSPTSHIQNDHLSITEIEAHENLRPIARPRGRDLTQVSDSYHPAVDAVVHTFHAQMDQITVENQIALNVIKAQGETDADAFRARMNAQRDKVKAESDHAIDDAYNKLTTIGQQQPQAQSAIQQATQQIQQIASAADSAIGDAVNSMLSGISSAAGTVIGGVSSAAGTVASGASTAASTVAGGAASVAGSIGSGIASAGSAIGHIFGL